VIKNQIIDKLPPAGTITPTIAKAADSEIGRLAAQYKGSVVGSEREYGLALAQAQAELRDLIARYNPNTAPVIKRANAGWAQLVQIETAAARVGAKDGIITPAQYMSAVKTTDRSLRDRDYAHGEALNQEFANDANKVLPSTYPDSGTTGRAITAFVLGGGLSHLTPPVLGGLGAGVAAYAPGVNQIVSKAIAGNRPQAAVTFSDLLKRAAPYAPLAASAPMQSLEP
jgi:hypothetical protein